MKKHYRRKWSKKKIRRDYFKAMELVMKGNADIKQKSKI